MSNHPPDDIEAIFASITPEDFIRSTSALWTQRYADLPDAHRNIIGVTGQDNFNHFVGAMLAVCRDAAARSVGFHTFAVIHNIEMQRRFVPDADETLSDFAARLTRESQSVGATWLFTAVLSQGRVCEDTPAPIDTSDLTEIERALADGRLSRGICWTAALREVDSSHDRGGIMWVDDCTGEITGEVEGELDTSTNLFQHVLDAP